MAPVVYDWDFFVPIPTSPKVGSQMSYDMKDHRTSVNAHDWILLEND